MFLPHDAYQFVTFCTLPYVHESNDDDDDDDDERAIKCSRSRILNADKIYATRVGAVGAHQWQRVPCYFHFHGQRA